MPTALSPHNPRIERVRDLRKPQARRERGRFVLEGPTLLGEAHRSGLTLEELYGTEAALAANASLAAALEAGGTAVFTLPERTLARLSDLETPPGLVAVARTPAGNLTAILARPGAILLLAGIADPGNAGTLLRSAEAFGAAGVLFGAGSVDAFAPKVVRGAMGSLFRLPVATVAAGELMEAAAATGRPIVAATLDGAPLSTTEIPANAVLAVGNERHGVTRFLPRWDLAVRIEQASAIESLNAAVAGSILLYCMALRKGQK